VAEDIHTANERRLGEIIGTGIAGKLERSRNEQIVADMRFWLRDELRKLEGWLSDLLRVVAARARRRSRLSCRGIRIFSAHNGSGGFIGCRAMV